MTPRNKPIKRPQRLSSGSDHSQMLAGLNILIIEDIGMVALTLRSMLEELGCTVTGIASRNAEAEKLAREEPLDGALLDLNLGGEYSFGVTKILRERKIPFIIMSGYDVDHLCPELADEPQMPKPFDRGPLEDMMLEVFCGQKRKKADADADTSYKPLLKTREELESAACLGMTRFEQEYMGRAPKDVQAHLLNDLLIIRMCCVMSFAEQHLVETRSAEFGRDLVKEMYTQMMEGARKQVDSMIQLITGVTVRSLHYDISTKTGEKVVVFTLSAAPTCREDTRGKD